MTILDTIVEEKQREVARLPQRAVSMADLQSRTAGAGGLRDFAGALRRPNSGLRRADRRGQEGLAFGRGDLP